jgi:hypothetical protein
MGILVLILFFGILQPVLGMSFTAGEKDSDGGLIDAFCAGYFVVCGTFYLPAMLGIAAGISLSFLTVFFFFILISLSVFSAYRNRKRIRMLPENLSAFFRGISLLEIAAFAAVLIQILAVVFCLHYDQDDSYYIAYATSAVDTNQLFAFDPSTGEQLISAAYEQSQYFFAPVGLLYAVLSVVSGIRPVILAHTLLPVPMLLCTYGISMGIGRVLFRGDRKKNAIFLLFASLAVTCSYFSIYTAGTFTLVRIWQGKAQIAAIVLPAVLLFFMRLAGTMKDDRRQWLFLLLIFLTAALLTSLGMILSLLSAGILTLILCVRKKDWKMILKLAVCALPCLVIAILYLLV